MTKSILIGTYTPSNQCYASYLINIVNFDRLLEEKNIKNDYIFRSDETISLSKNLIIKYFLSSEYTDLLLLDGEIDVNANNLYKLIESDKDFIGLIYPEKNINWENITIHSNILSLTELDNIQEYGKIYDYKIKENINSEIIEVEKLKCGATLINKNVFIKYIEKYPNDYFYLHGEKVYKFFDTYTNEKEYISEDAYFCNKCHTIGNKMYIYNITCNCYGYKRFE